uniref:Fibrinogen C-terminal domain-containing protein n=1 Tax=Macrostomum lignano TaxID=282301 RepID=A0A1I8JEP8_9PLAT
EGANTSQWIRVRDDLLGEYTEIGAVAASNAVACCSSGMTAAHAVQFDEAQRLCRLFACRGGWRGCRKCRNAANSSLPHVWVRKLGDGRSCWRTFQHRVDASVNFNESWAKYASGFGQGENANFWIGLDNLHLLTRDAALPVRWEFSDWNGTLNWMENAFFQVDSATTKYRVSVGEQLMDRSTVKQCSDNSTSSMNGQQFSAPDQDNDVATGGSCAAFYGGGWWMQACCCLFPNGPYVSLPAALHLITYSRGI